MPDSDCGEGSPEAVALNLLKAIARHDDKYASGHLSGDKEWILTTYRDCLDAVRHAPPAKGHKVALDMLNKI